MTNKSDTTTRHEQGIFVDLKTLEELGNPTDAIIYSLIKDRMKSSVTSEKFYDQKTEQFYVIFTRDQLKEYTGCSLHTISNSFTRLRNLGYIATVTTMKANKIFLQDEVTNQLRDNYLSAESSESEHTNVHNVNNNHFNNHINNTSNTVNTTQPAQSFKFQPMELWKQATHERVGLPMSSLDLIAQFTKNNLDNCKAVVRLIFNARSAVVKENDLQRSAVTQFETNDNVRHTLTAKLRNVFGYVIKHGFKAYAGYITKALKNYFLQVFGIKADEPDHVAPKAPKQGRVVETLPEWAQRNKENLQQGVPVKTLTAEQERQLDEKIALLKKP